MPLADIGALLGKFFAQGDEAQGRKYQDQELGQLSGIGDASYAPISTQQVGPMDPQLRGVLEDVINRYGQVAKGGYTPEDKAAVVSTMRDVANANRGQREAVLQRAEAEGGLGSGNGLMAALQGEQAQADAAGTQGANLAIAARQRALDAYGKEAEAASSLAGRDDAINEFNARNRADTSMFNSNLGREGYLDTLGAREAKAGAYGRAAGQAFNRADQTTGIGYGIGKSYDQALQAGMGMMTGAAGGGMGGFGMASPRAPAGGGGFADSGYSTGYSQAPQPIAGGQPQPSLADQYGYSDYQFPYQDPRRRVA